VFYVNPNRQGWGFSGWKEIVHGVSHYAHRRKHPDKKPHDFRHLLLEREMVQYAVENGFLDGKLKRAEKPLPPARDVKVARAQKLADQIARWEAKERRARAALKKLRPKLARYQRMGVIVEAT
jgi:hypothetical protein